MATNRSKHGKNGGNTVYSPTYKMTDPKNMKVQTYHPKKPIPEQTTTGPQKQFKPAKDYQKKKQYKHKEYVPWMSELEKKPRTRPPQNPVKEEPVTAAKPKPEKVEPVIAAKPVLEEKDGLPEISAMGSILRTLSLFKL